MLDSLKNKFQLRFKDRVSAAKILTGSLEDSFKKVGVNKKDKESLRVLAIPRGGVIVGDILASKLQLQFDIMFPRKIRAPHNEEIAIGAIMEEGIVYLYDEMIRELDISQEYIEQEKLIQIKEIERRKSMYRTIEKEYDIDGKVVILVDDGAATGATLIAASRWIKKQHNPSKLIIAIPVTSKETFETLQKECDLVVTGTTPSTSTFRTVGQYYQEFKHVNDEEVIEICKRKGLVYS